MYAILWIIGTVVFAVCALGLLAFCIALFKIFGGDPDVGAAPLAHTDAAAARYPE